MIHLQNHNIEAFHQIYLLSNKVFHFECHMRAIENIPFSLGIVLSILILNTIENSFSVT